MTYPTYTVRRKFVAPKPGDPIYEQPGIREAVDAYDAAIQKAFETRGAYEHALGEVTKAFMRLPSALDPYMNEQFVWDAEIV